MIKHGLKWTWQPAVKLRRAQSNRPLRWGGGAPMGSLGVDCVRVFGGGCSHHAHQAAALHSRTMCNNCKKKTKLYISIYLLYLHCTTALYFLLYMYVVYILGCYYNFIVHCAMTIKGFWFCFWLYFSVVLNPCACCDQFFCICCLNILDANISVKGTVFELFYLTNVTRQAKFYCYLKVDVYTVVNVNIMQFCIMKFLHFYSDFYLEL